MARIDETTKTQSGLKFTPKQIALFESQATRVPGMNNSGRNRYREEGAQALLYQELEKLRKEEEIASRMEMRPVRTKTVSTADKIKGKKDEYERVPLVVGMSGADPLLSLYPEIVGFNGIGALAKTGLLGAGRFFPKTWIGNYGRQYFVGNAFKNSFNGIVPTLSSQTTSLLYLPAKLNETGLTSLKFFERKPSRITEDERLGRPKGDRNNKRNINPDNIYGNLRFIRNIDGLPTVKNGLVQLGNPDKLLTNFTTDLPFRLHDWYPNIPGPTYITVSPRAFKGKRFYSIKPSDSFLSTMDSKVTPNQVRIISGDPKILEEAEKRGMRTLTSDKLQDLFNVGSEITKKEFELGRNGAIRPFANVDVAIDNFKFRNHFYGEDVPEILSKYPEGVITPYRAEVDRLITQNIGRPSIKDYLTLEDMTGLNAGITNKFDPKLIKKAKDPLANRDMFGKVYYPVTSQIEEKLMNSIGLYPSPYYSFSNLLKLDKLNGNPIKHKQGGKMNTLELFKKGHKIHIKKENRGKFTAYCGGNVTSSCIARAKASGNPTLVKRATFAANARKWKHLRGGVIEGAYTLYNGLPIKTVNLPEVIVTGNEFKYLNTKSEKEKNNFFRPFTKFIFGSYSTPKDSYFNATIPYGLGPGHERDNIIQVHSGKSGEMDRLGMYGAIKGKDGKYRFKNPNYKPSQDPEYQRLKNDLGFGNSSDAEFLKWCAENGNRLNLALGLPTAGDSWTRHGIFGDSLIIQSPDKKEDYWFGSDGVKAKRLARSLGDYVAKNIDKHELKTGDIVDMYYKGSDFLNKAFREGDNNRTNSHTGTILRTGRDKEHTYVVHSTGDGLNIQPIGELLKPGLLSKSYITGIRRPGSKKHPYKK